MPVNIYNLKHIISRIISCKFFLFLCAACRLQVRYLMSCMISIGLFLVYSMRVNLSVTIIAMVNATAVNGNTSSASNVSCPVPYRNASYIDGGDESGVRFI